MAVRIATLGKASWACLGEGKEGNLSDLRAGARAIKTLGFVKEELVECRLEDEFYNWWCIFEQLNISFLRRKTW